MGAHANKPDSKRESKHPPGIEKVARNAAPFQRREWLVQRIGWAVLGLIILAALAGLFGRGPLSDRQLTNDAGLLEYERFARRSADTRWELTVRNAAMGAPVEIAVNADFAAHFEIRSIHPEPSATALRGGDWVYIFESRANGDARVSFVVMPQKIGEHAGTLRVGDAPGFHFSQFIYP